MRRLTAFEKRLLNTLQTGLPIIERPYAEIGKNLGVNEQTALKRTRGLVKRGVIRRFGAVINWRAIGKASTLVTACVPEKKLKKVVAAVNRLEGISHNYLREHHYNLWFTLRADSQSEIRAILTKLSKQFGLEFHNLPVKRTFKLDVRFDARSNGRRLLATAKPTGEDGLPSRDTKYEMRNTKYAVDKRILERLRGGLKVVARPYDFFDDEFENYDCLLHIAGMIGGGVIYRIGAVVNHRKLGFTANAMFVCQANPRQMNARASEAKVVDLGQRLAKLNIVSHCYQRKRFPGWVYNLYAMMHSRSQTDIQRQIEKFVRKNGIKKWELLKTVRTLKK